MANTSFDTVISAFLRQAETDIKFFDYPGMTPESSLEIAKERAQNYLLEACSIVMTLYPAISVDFTDYDVEAREFSFELSNREIMVLAFIMCERHMARDIMKLKLETVNYSSNDIRAYSPDNWRTSFMSMYDNLHSRTMAVLDGYANTNRDDGGYAEVDYSLYDTSEG